jgi:hypothetical protein
VKTPHLTEERRMMDDPNEPVVLTTVPSEAQAAIIVAALRERGIEAQAIGQLTSGFRAEAPGWVKVLVRQADRAAAQAVLRGTQRG